MALLTAQDYILLSMRKLGQMRPGYIPSPEILSEYLNDWDAFFDELTAELSMNWSNPAFTYPVTGAGSVSGGNGYIIGPVFAIAGQIVAGFPQVIETASALPPYPFTSTAPMVGQKVTGPGIPAGSYVVSSNAAGQYFTINNNCTATGTFSINLQPDFLGPRPEIITSARLVMTNTQPNPVYIRIRLITQEEWGNLAIRNIPAIQVTSLAWYDPQFPCGVFNVFPPLNGNSIELFTSGTLTAPFSLSTPWSAPAGYADLIIWGLAERNYYSMTKEMNARTITYSAVCARASEARKKIRRINRPAERMGCDFKPGRTPGGFYDSFVTYTGEPY